MLNPRAALRNMKEYHPPLSGRSGLRLDFNENTVGCSPKVLAVLRETTAEMLTIYPERDSVEGVVAQYLGRTDAPFASGQLLLTNGVDEAIHLVCETYLDPEDEVLIAVPTFAMYEIYALATGARVKAIQANEDFSVPVDRLLAAITPRTRLIAIATPNNPTGSIVSRADLLRIAKACPQAALLVDEAYIHFGGEPVLHDVNTVPNLFVVRTFSKVYGLANLRIGVLVSAAENMVYVRKVSSPYNLNGVALRCLPVALADKEYVSHYVAEILAGRDRLEQHLKSLGMPYWQSHANFILMHVGEKHKDLVQAMRQRGILVRDRSADPGCLGCVRITVGDKAQMDRALIALDEALKEIQWIARLQTDKGPALTGAGR